MAHRGASRPPGQAGNLPRNDETSINAAFLRGSLSTMSVVDTLRLVVAPPHPAGYRFIAAGLVVFFVGLPLARLAGLARRCCSPCSACISSATPSACRRPARARAGARRWPRRFGRRRRAPPKELGLGDAPRWRVSIFLSVLDVHVNRMPVDGTVTRMAYRHGKFLNASWTRRARTTSATRWRCGWRMGATMAVVQIAGLIARRIVCDVREGDVLRAGERFGIIRFGSRTDLYLPEGVRPLVAVGQTMIGGETVIADLAA